VDDDNSINIIKEKVELIDEIIQYFGAKLQERQSIYPLVANEVQEIINSALFQMYKQEREEKVIFF